MIRNWFCVARVLIPLIAGGSLFVSLIATIVTADFLRDAKSVTGTIIESDTKIGDEGKLLYRPTFTFTVDGRDYSVTPSAFVSPSLGDIGDQVPVLHDPSKPSNARIDTFVYTWMIPTVTFLLALMLGIIHFAIAWFSQNFRHVGADGG